MSFLARRIRYSFLDYRNVHVSNDATNFLHVFRLGRTVCLVLKSECDRGFASVLIAKHLQPSWVPEVQSSLHILNAVVAFAASSHLRDLLQQFATAAKMERLFLEHRPHASRHGRIAEDLLHVELILADEINHRCISYI